MIQLMKATQEFNAKEMRKKQIIIKRGTSIIGDAGFDYHAELGKEFETKEEAVEALKACKSKVRYIGNNVVVEECHIQDIEEGWLELAEFDEKGYNEISNYENQGFDFEQLLEIQKGLNDNLQVEIYAITDFEAGQMEEIRKGLKAGLDVEKYADPEIDECEMEDIREELLLEKFKRK